MLLLFSGSVLGVGVIAALIIGIDTYKNKITLPVILFSYILSFFCFLFAWGELFMFSHHFRMILFFSGVILTGLSIYMERARFWKEG